MTKMTTKQRAAWERERDLNTELREHAAWMRFAYPPYKIHGTRRRVDKRACERIHA